MLLQAVDFEVEPRQSLRLLRLKANFLTSPQTSHFSTEPGRDSLYKREALFPMFLPARSARSLLCRLETGPLWFLPASRC